MIWFPHTHPIPTPEFIGILQSSNYSTQGTNNTDKYPYSVVYTLLLQEIMLYEIIIRLMIQDPSQHQG